MLNRRHIRIKVLQILYAYHQSEQRDIQKGLKELLFSIERMYDMYILLLMTLPDLKQIAESKISDRKNKIRPTEEDLFPNEKFVRNTLINEVTENKQLNTISLKRKLNWSTAEQQEVIRKIFLEIEESETFFDFMNNGQVGRRGTLDK